MSTLLLPAVAVLALPGADDGDPPAARSTPPSLALTAQTSLLAQAGRYRQLEQEVAQRADRAAAGPRRRAGRARAGRRRSSTSSAPTAADLYRAAPTAAPTRCSALERPRPRRRPPTSLYRQAVAERADRGREGAVVRAERTGAALAAAPPPASPRPRPPSPPPATGPPASSPTVRDEVEDLSPAVTAPARRARHHPGRRRRSRTATSTAVRPLAGLPRPSSPPPASSRRRRPRLADPARPARRALPRAGRGRPPDPRHRLGRHRQQPGHRAARRDRRGRQHGAVPARQALRRPAPPGPDTYDCGGFTSAAWLLAGYAVPSTPESQWAAGARGRRWPTCRSATSSSPPAARTSASTSATATSSAPPPARYQVGVRSVAAGSSAIRVTLPAPATPNAALPAAGDDRPLRCCRCRRPGVGHPGVGRLGQRPDPGRGAVRAGRRPPRAALRRRGVLRRDERGLRVRLRVAAVHHRLLPVLRQPGVGVRPQAGAWPRCRARPTTAGRWRSTCAAASTSPAAPQWTWMTANAGRFGFVQPGLGAPGRREARAVALGVRLHLLTPRPGPALSVRRAGRTVSQPGQVGELAATAA